MIETGTLLQDRFVVEEQIGRGGMGAVYIATDTKFGSRVAIKERSYEDPELAQAFEREARLLNSLHHPILPHVSDYFSEAGRYFLVMEFIDGEDLSTVLASQGAFPVDQVVRWTDELLDGLDYLHSQDPPVIHRDIKPGNLKLTSRGNIVLLDFGLAKESENNTLAGRSVFGYSRRYSPLEQIEGTGTDARSDIFSLGATVYHLITGEPPIDVLARASAIIAGRPDPLKLASEINEQVPTPLARVINSALALNAEQRFVSANAVRSALQYAISGHLPVIEEKLDNESVSTRSFDPASRDAFPALEAFRTGEYDLIGETAPPEVVETPLPVNPARVAVERPQSRVRVRFIQPLWQKTAVWTAAALAVLLVVSYVVYRASWSRSANEVPAEQSTTGPADLQQSIGATGTKTANTTAASAPETSPDADEPSTKDSTETIAESSEMPLKNRSTVEKPRQTVAAEPAKSTSETEQRTVPAFNARNTAAQQPVTHPVKPAFERPRVVRPAFERQAPVYSIETIITGVPPAGDRRRPQRQLSMWEQDQLRRQRFEDMIRTTRRWQPPF